jgi:predicted Zn finger-like uncharacterized protein
MQIVCPNCTTSYKVPAAAFGAGERSVRCARCHAVWVTSAVPAAMLGTDAGDSPARTDGPAPPRSPAAPPAADMPLAQQAPRPEPEMADANDPVAEQQGREPVTEKAGGQPPDWIDNRVEQTLSGAADQHDDQGSPQPADVAPDPGADPTVANTVEGAPPLAPELPDNGATTAEEMAPASEPPEDIESVAARRAQGGKLRRLRRWPSLSTTIIALLVIVSVLIGWRNDVVRLMPQTASFFSAIGLGVNLRGLAFADVRTSREQNDGVNVLVVEGKIVSRVPKPIEVPRLRFAVRDKTGQEIYAWTALPPRSILAPGKSLPFHSRLASPPPQTSTVLVRFFNRRDIVAGTR